MNSFLELSEITLLVCSRHSHSKLVLRSVGFIVLRSDIGLVSSVLIVWSPLFAWMTDFSYLIGANFSDPKTVAALEPIGVDLWDPRG